MDKIAAEQGLCSFSEAKDLKQMGFSELCTHWYFENKNTHTGMLNRFYDNRLDNWNKSPIKYSAPTIEQMNIFLNSLDN